MEIYADNQRVKQLIYGGDIYNEEEYESMLDKIDDFPRGTEHGCRRPSLYLRLFEDMINTVYEHESHLLSQSEWDVFATLKCYCYNARYCLVRLVLRKPDQWHALSSLGGYKKEVGEVGLVRAITDLCRPWDEVMNDDYSSNKEKDDGGVKVEQQVIEDLAFLEEEEDVKMALLNAEEAAGPASRAMDQEETCQDGFQQVQLDSFCYDESSMDTTALLSRLSVKQLQDLVKTTKTKPAKSNKPEMIRALLAHAATQSVLDFPESPADGRRRRPPDPCLRQTKLAFEVKTTSKGKGKAVPRNQEQWLVQMVLKILGKCVKVNGDFHRLVRRLHLICFRCTEQPTALLLPALLTSFRKRAYPKYKYMRDKSIWPTRDDLLAYEEALALEVELEELGSKAAPKVLQSSFRPSTTPIGNILRTPWTPFKTPKDSPLDSNTKQEAEDRTDDIPAAEEEEASVRKAKKIREFLCQRIYPRWKENMEAKANGGCSTRKPGFERFEPGYIYTRMLHHASRCFATFKEYQAEYDLIQDLLGQRFYRRGSRAKWYERRAILQMMYLSKTEGRKRDQDVLRQALVGVKEALADEDTGIVWRPALFRRLQRLEKMLHVPEEECAPPEAELGQPQRVFVKAIRAVKREGSAPMDTSSRHVNTKNAVGTGGLHSYFTPKREMRDTEEFLAQEDEKNNRVPKRPKTPSWKGKSLWVGRDNEEVHVEIRVLQYYESLGFKGLHSETRILTTIFSLLFWDIIFADVPGSFETPYQTAPLDLAEDTFYFARKDMIEQRLEEIHDGKAKEILERHDDEHREKQTMCIGLRWDICEKKDLVEILECLGGRTLSLVCRLFCEDYGGRSSGVPDLVIWDADQGICKFVEVKGPGDRPQENQKLWFDSLLRAGANVEICHVIDINAAPKEKSKTPNTRRKRKAQSLSTPAEENDEHDQQLNDNDEWGPPSDHHPPSDLVGRLPKRKRKKTVDDELPSYFPPVTPSRLARKELDLPQPSFILETPCKRKKGQEGSFSRGI
ncbi:VRR-NUC domain containing protein [Amanita muscaria]